MNIQTLTQYFLGRADHAVGRDLGSKGGNQFSDRHAFISICGTDRKLAPVFSGKAGRPEGDGILF